MYRVKKLQEFLGNIVGKTGKEKNYVDPFWILKQNVASMIVNNGKGTAKGQWKI